VHERDLGDVRRQRIGVRADPAGPQRIDVLRADALGEVDVAPVAPDIADQLVARTIWCGLTAGSMCQ